MKFEFSSRAPLGGALQHPNKCKFKLGSIWRWKYTWLPFWLVCWGSDRSPSRLSKSRADPIMVVWSRSRGDSGDSPGTTPSCRDRLRDERVLLLTDFCTFVEFSRSCELLWWCCWSLLCTSGSPILISLSESWDSPLVSASVGGGAIMCRCSCEREGGAPCEECRRGGVGWRVGGIGWT